MKSHRPLFTALVLLLVVGQAVFAQSAKNMSLLGNYGRGEGDSKAVFAAGSLVFFGLGNKVQIASFSNPATPVRIATVILSETVESLVRTSIGGTLYLVASGGSKMWLINVQNPTAPVLTSTVEVAPGTTCEGIATSGSYAYVAAGAAGLKIYNIATPSAPSLVASIDSLAYCESVVISFPYAYVAANDANYVGKSYIIDVSNPAAPVYKSTIYGYGGYHQYMGVRSSNYAYICDYETGLQVINVTAATNPVNVVAVPAGSRQAASIVFDGNYGYVAVGNAGLFVYDLTNPAAPVYVTKITTGGRAAFVSYGAITIGGSPKGHIYVSNRDTPGCVAVNVSDPKNPTVSGTLWAAAAASGSAFSPFYSGGKVYVAYGSAGLRIIDVTTPSQPTLLSTLKLAGESRGVATTGGYVYVATNDSGVHVVDATNPASPVRLTTLPTWRSPGIAINGNFVYVASRDSGLVILNVANPASPVWLKTVGGTSVENVAAVGNVLGTSFYSSIRFYDVTDPANPVPKGSTPAFRVGNEGLAIAGAFAYAPDGDSLKIFNISNLNAPALVSRVKTGGTGYAAAVVGNYCYVASEATGVRAINISNPAVPVEDGYYDGAPLTRGVAAAGEYVYVTEKADGLDVYHNDLVTSVEDAGTVPGVFMLEQNYPNPFNPTTSIHYQLSTNGDVSLKVYDLLGREVRVLVSESKAPGSYTLRFDASGLPSGMYVYRLMANGFSAARTMMLVK